MGERREKRRRGKVTQWPLRLLLFFSRLPGCGGEWRAALFLFPSPPHHHRPYISLPNLHQEKERKEKGEGIFIQSFAEGKADFAVGERKGEGGLAEKAARFKSAQGKGSLLRPRGEREGGDRTEGSWFGPGGGRGRERGFFNYWMLPPLLPLPLSDRRRERGERKREGSRLSGGGRGSSWGREVAFPSSSFTPSSDLLSPPLPLFSHGWLLDGGRGGSVWRGREDQGGPDSHSRIKRRGDPAPYVQDCTNCCCTEQRNFLMLVSKAFPYLGKGADWMSQLSPPISPFPPDCVWLLSECLSLFHS